MTYETRIANNVEIAVARATENLRIIQHGRKNPKTRFVEIADQFGCIEITDNMADAEARVQEACANT